MAQKTHMSERCILKSNLANWVNLIFYLIPCDRIDLHQPEQLTSATVGRCGNHMANHCLPPSAGTVMAKWPDSRQDSLITGCCTVSKSKQKSYILLS